MHRSDAHPGTWGERRQKPSILRISGSDPDNADSVPSAGDEIVILFDRLTNRGKNAKPAPPEVRPSAEYVDFFFTFTPELGTYTGDFRDDSTFVIAILEGNPEWDAGAQPMVQVRSSGGLKSSGGASDAANEEYAFSTLVFGNPGPPRCVGASVRDYDNFNEAWSGGDEVRVVFDRATDEGRARAAGGREYVDSL